MRYIRLISIYIGNLNYKIEIPFYLPVFCIESVITKYNAMSFFMLNASYTCC